MCMFKAPKPVAPPPVPRMTDPEIEAASDAERRRRLAARGRRSTILTGPGGDMASPSIGQKTLLGQ